MQRPTRQEQAQAILNLKARVMASRILGQRATTSADFTAAFTVERIDILSEIPDEERLLALGRNVAGPTDGLYVIDDGGTYRVYIQESGIPRRPSVDLTFDEARDAAIERLLLLNGIPWTF
jgi:hypothetical protein